jgi:AmmeMemoRadiSam system protein B
MSSSIRKPAVAGAFYPADPGALRRQLKTLTADGEECHELLACISPHAGYIYSGRVAGRLFAQLEVPRRVLVMGPNHGGIGAPVAVAPHHTWQTPIGDVAIDRELGELLVDRVPGADFDSSAHWREHSIEVQLPFLLDRQPDLLCLPVCLRHISLDDCLQLGEVVAELIAAVDGPVGLVASSDMTHFEPDDSARERDQKAIDAALTLDPEALYSTVHDHGITMCGVIPATVTMAAARAMGATSAELVAYDTSAATSGNRSSVVGYAAIRIDR